MNFRMACMSFVAVLMMLFPAVNNLAAESRLPSATPKNLRYQLREDNRYEGITSRVLGQGTAELISVVLKPVAGFGKHLPASLILQIPLSLKDTQRPGFPYPEDKPEVVIREVRKNYRLDPLVLRPTGPQLSFEWSTEVVMKPAGIKPADLQAIAKDYSDWIYPVLLYAPGIRGRCRYEFGIYAEDKFVAVQRLSIYSLNNPKTPVFDFRPGTALPRSELFTVPWDGLYQDGKPLAQGQYAVKFSAEVMDNKKGAHLSYGEYVFWHDPRHLKAN